MPLRILLLIFAIAQAVTPYLPNLLGFGRQIGEGSQAIFPLVPAGYTFAIRAPIFIGCIAFAVYSLMPTGRGVVPDWILRRLLIVFILIAARSVIVSFTNLFRLPPVIFAWASILLLTITPGLAAIPALQSGWQYRLLFVPLMLFVGRCNTAFRLNIGTAFMDYDLRPWWRSRQTLAIIILTILLFRHHITIVVRSLPLPVIATYLRAISGLIVTSIGSITSPIILTGAFIHALLLVIVMWIRS